MTLFEYKMPELGEGLHEGEIVKWLAKPGDAVKEDDILMEVQNDKAVVEVPSPVTGVVKELKVAEGQTAVVGDTIALIETDAEVPGSGDVGKEPEAEGPDGASDPRENPLMVLATPAVRKLARERQVPIEQVKGSGKHGRVTREDVIAFAEQKGGLAADKAVAETEAAGRAESGRAESGRAESGWAESGREEAGRAAAKEADQHQPEKRVPLKGIRKAIAQAMTRSVYTAPHVTIMDEANVAKLVEFRSRFKPEAEARGVKLTYLPFVVKALVAAVRQFPALNASIDDEREEVVYKSYYHVGIATDTEQGLLVPVIRDADRKNIWTIAAEIQDLAHRAREGKLTPAEMKGSTVSVTNIGSAGGMFFTPVINWPEVAILGIGRIADKPAVRDGQLTVGQMMAISLSFDHRLVDGAAAQQAVNVVKRLLEDPELLVMEV